MKASHGRTWGVALAATAALLGGCKDARKDRLEGAERALSALPDVEVVATDADAGVLKVRSRSSGEVTVIDLGTAATSGRGAPAMAAATTASGKAGDDAGTAGSAAASTAAGTPVAADLPGGAAAGPPATLPAEPGTAAAPLPPGSVATPDTVAAAAASAPVVVRDPQGRVQVIEGSGFRIERAPSPRGAGSANRSTGAAAGGAAGATASGELRRVGTPVVCGTGETRSLQGLLIDVPGAGIVAERGCNLTLANVRVRSGGWGLVVNPGASVRIDDSVIEGRSGALDLYPGATLSAWATSFRGALGRPATAPQFVDRGGNTWQ